MRLFKRGDTIASDTMKRKLQREFAHTSELANHIYWTDIGRVGHEHFKQQLREKTMASRMCATIPGEVSAEKAHKMLRKSVEVQNKADAEKMARMARTRLAKQPSRYANSDRNTNGRRSRPANRQSRSRNTPTRPHARSTSSRRPSNRKPASSARRA